MISRKFRISRPEFNLVKRTGHLLDSLHFSARVLWASENGYAKYAVVISSKTLRKAVARNHLRRTLYDCLSPGQSVWSGYVILYPKPSVINLSDEEICSQLDSLLSKIHS